MQTSDEYINISCACLSYRVWFILRLGSPIYFSSFEILIKWIVVKMTFLRDRRFQSLSPCNVVWDLRYECSVLILKQATWKSVCSKMRKVLPLIMINETNLRLFKINWWVYFGSVRELIRKTCTYYIFD